MGLFSGSSQTSDLSTKTECDYRYGWIQNRSHAQKSHKKMVNPRDKAGIAEEEEKDTSDLKIGARAATQVPGVTASALGLVGPVSVCCD